MTLRNIKLISFVFPTSLGNNQWYALKNYKPLVLYLCFIMLLKFHWSNCYTESLLLKPIIYEIFLLRKIKGNTHRKPLFSHLNTFSEILLLTHIKRTIWTRLVSNPVMFRINKKLSMIICVPVNLFSRILEKTKIHIEFTNRSPYLNTEMFKMKFKS